MKRIVAPFLAAVLFALGLGVAGMTRPTKVLGFLTWSRDWDPSLAFVMVGAILTYGVLFRLTMRRPAPVAEPTFDLPKRYRIDTRLVLGAAVFGVGWGLGGLCPGPAVVAMATGDKDVVLFVGAMVVGMLLERGVNKIWPPNHTPAR